MNPSFFKLRRHPSVIASKMFSNEVGRQNTT
jgi:hypothetical protein